MQATLVPVPYDQLTDIERQLVDAASQAASNPYAPYSEFPVGAAVLATNPDGESRIFAGCNIENASYGLTVCAERTTTFIAVAAGHRQILMAAVICLKAPGPEGSPCGACRQVLREFAPNGDPAQMQMLIVWDQNRSVVRLTLADLLPLSFGPTSLSHPADAPA